MAINIKKYHIFALGCQMNKSDGERIAAVLETVGFKPTAKEAEAEVIIAVACSVRQTAIDRIYGKARQWQNRRRLSRLTTILTGCVLDRDREKMRELFDLMIPIKEINRLPELLRRKTSRDLPGGADYLRLPPRRDSSFQAYVPIMTGCNNYCSYCVVPYVRGREISRPANEVITECQKLLAQGYKEITLLGQNVNSYRSGRYDFPRLLCAIDRLPGDYWLRFATSHPKDLSDDLIAAMAGGRHLTPYLHLPIQSGDAKVLLAMNRHYTPSRYLRLIAKARQKIPGLTISTDVIVGFPGETKSQFSNTAKVLRQVGFDMVYINKYSPRSGTAAFLLADDVSWAEKKRREKLINEILKRTAKNRNAELINKTVRILVDGWKNGYCFGRSDAFKTVAFPGGRELIGKFAAVRIGGAGSWGLKGELI